ncbi:MAG: UDP-N-acetylenolpyruvoylglucosamine reductase, partial [Clostridia bacterium]|nr:UDP-N-acetylenolpyruvoylglucosamine reductase [Clostridia bacterium]
GDRQTIKDKMADFMQRRKEKQPLHLPSAGSTFKRPEGAFAGKLIQDCGLKGFQIGGAAVSEKHAGFVVNLDNATFRDVKDLIEFVQKKVKEETGYFLACEVEIIE